MPLTLFNSLTRKERKDAVASLIEESTPRQYFFLLVGVAVGMATIGIYLNSAAIVIGSMLIAPILYPFLTLALGVVISDMPLISRSFVTAFKAIFLAVAVGAFVAVFLPSSRSVISEHSFVATPTFAYSVVGFLAGLAASFAASRPTLNESLPGVAISVALIPPLAVAGMGLARFNWLAVSEAMTLFAVNVAGIVFASVIVFSLMRFYDNRMVAREVVHKENRKVKREEKRAQKAARE